MPPVYKHLNLYTTAKSLVVAAYELTHDLPEDERSLSGQKFRATAMAAYLDIVKALCRKKKKKQLKKARLQLLLLDGLLDVFIELKLVDANKANDLNYLLIRCLEQLKKPGA
jgi:hypothetical protein